MTGVVRSIVLSSFSFQPVAVRRRARRPVDGAKARHLPVHRPGRLPPRLSQPRAGRVGHLPQLGAETVRRRRVRLAPSAAVQRPPDAGDAGAERVHRPSHRRRRSTTVTSTTTVGRAATSAPARLRRRHSGTRSASDRFFQSTSTRRAGTIKPVLISFPGRSFQRPRFCCRFLFLTLIGKLQVLSILGGTFIRSDVYELMVACVRVRNTSKYCCFNRRPVLFVQVYKLCSKTIPRSSTHCRVAYICGFGVSVSKQTLT